MIAVIERQSKTKPRKSIPEHLEDNEWTLPKFVLAKLRNFFSCGSDSRPIPPWRNDEPQVTRDELIDAVGWLMIWHWSDLAESRELMAKEQQQNNGGES